MLYMSAVNFLHMIVSRQWHLLLFSRFLYWCCTHLPRCWEEIHCKAGGGERLWSPLQETRFCCCLSCIEKNRKGKVGHHNINCFWPLFLAYSSLPRQSYSPLLEIKPSAKLEFYGTVPREEEEASRTSRNINYNFLLWSRYYIDRSAEWVFIAQLEQLRLQVFSLHPF